MIFERSHQEGQMKKPKVFSSRRNRFHRLKSIINYDKVADLQENKSNKLATFKHLK